MLSRQTQHYKKIILISLYHFRRKNSTFEINNVYPQLKKISDYRIRNGGNIHFIDNEFRVWSHGERSVNIELVQFNQKFDEIMEFTTISEPGTPLVLLFVFQKYINNRA